MREGDAELLRQENPPDDSYAVYAYKQDIEAMYPHLVSYVQELQRRESSLATL